MNNNQKCSVLDPDYEITEMARERFRLKENRENKEKAEKIRTIINREFQIELNHRQSQLELIQQRLNQAQKTLHLLRYVLITAYYGNKDVEENQTAETKAENSTGLNKNRLHPAVKKLLGNYSNDKFNYMQSPRKKMKYFSHPKDISEQIEKAPAAEISELSNHTIIESNETNIQSSNTVNEIKRLNNNGKEELDFGRNRKKTKYRVVVGNISKWMPSKSEEDKSTHKWMVYVRGPKENPDISHFVQKVVFYLHPSYQPNDVVELREGPFHLSRRGWGEFPLRVRIFFQCSLNKPVDIIHNLKLDKTFTGRQTLGNETVVNLFLYENDKKPAQKTKRNTLECKLSIPLTIKKEFDEKEEINESNCKMDIVVHDDTLEHAMPNLEHDYCFVGIKQEIKEDSNLFPSFETLDVETQSSSTYNYLTEHSYCVNNSHPVTNPVLLNVEDEQDTNLIYGIEEMEQAKNEIIEEVVLDDVKIPVRKIVQNNYRKFIISNGTVIAIKKKRKPQESLLKKMFHKKYVQNKIGAYSSIKSVHNSSENPKHLNETNPVIDYDKYKINFPSHRFKNTQEALPYLFKRLPLITTVSDLNYKCTYPYAANSLDEYSRWNIGKRLSSEWFQAKTILNIVKAADIPDCKNWSVKSVIMYARSHGYTPLCSYDIFKNKKDLSQDVLNGTTNTECATTNSVATSKTVDCTSDVVVDIINCKPDPEPSTNSVNKERFVDHKLELECSYVKQTALDAGIVLKSEDIIPGVLFNAVERTLLQAALSLAEDLLRGARANLVLQGNFKEDTATIQVEDVQRVLHERNEFKILLKADIDN